MGKNGGNGDVDSLILRRLLEMRTQMEKMEQKLEAKIDGLEQRVTDRIDRLEKRLDERIDVLGRIFKESHRVLSRRVRVVEHKVGVTARR
jgi:hypothetical protein